MIAVPPGLLPLLLLHCRKLRGGQLVMSLCSKVLPPALLLPEPPHDTCAAKPGQGQRVNVSSSSLIWGFLETLRPGRHGRAFPNSFLKRLWRHFYLKAISGLKWPGLTCCWQEVLILYILPCELISSWHLPAADIVYWSSLVWILWLLILKEAFILGLKGRTAQFHRRPMFFIIEYPFAQ